MLWKMLHILINFLTFECLLWLFAVLGFSVFLNYLYENLRSPFGILKSLLVPFFQPELDVELKDKFGNWAVITGSTDGIGKAYAKELAKRGINVVLIARSNEKLMRVAKEIENEFSVKTKYIQADFSAGRQVYQDIEKALLEIPVGILVNNVGVMYEYPEEMSKVPEDVLWSVINVNIAACTMLTRMLTPRLKERGKGAIVNISSSMEQFPLINAAAYSASKIYIKYLTQALQYELSPFNITVQLISPMFVATKMNHFSDFVMSGSNPVVVGVDSYAKWAVFTLGKTDETTGHWNHGFQVALMKLVSVRFRTLVAGLVTDTVKKEYLSRK